jgi:predicted nucleic acid-binding protein
MILDTDVIIRFVTNDDEGKAGRVEKMLKSKKKIELLDVTVAEIYWVLRSYYEFRKAKIVEVLRSLVGYKKVKCNREVLSECLKILEETNTSFVDAYVAAWAKTKDDGKVMSFDKGFDKLEGIKQIEP